MTICLYSGKNTSISLINHRDYYYYYTFTYKVLWSFIIYEAHYSNERVSLITYMLLLSCPIDPLLLLGRFLCSEGNTWFFQSCVCTMVRVQYGAVSTPFVMKNGKKQCSADFLVTDWLPLNPVSSLQYLIEDYDNVCNAVYVWFSVLIASCQPVQIKMVCFHITAVKYIVNPSVIFTLIFFCTV